MRPFPLTFLLALCLLAFSALTFAQSGSTPLLEHLSGVMEEIQTKAQQQAATNPEAFKHLAAGIANKHLDEIIRASASTSAVERRLAASLLAIASPSDPGTEKLLILAADDVPDVRYAAIIAIATVTDGTNKRANAVILKALNETDNPGITRDASFAASSLKLIEALPTFELLLKSDEALNKRFAADAIARYGPLAASLLPELKRQMKVTDNLELKAIMQRAATSVERQEDVGARSTRNASKINSKQE